jgi:hypothetical protein
LIAQLGSRKFEEREAASKALDDIGLPILDTLRETVSTTRDAEIRRRASELVKRLERKYETELAFAWYDSLGFPDFAKCKFVRVATGRVYPYGPNETPKNSYDLAFLVCDDGSRFTVFEVTFDTHIYKKTGLDKPEYKKVGYESWDLKKEMVELLKSLDQPEDKDGFPRRPWERLGEPAELFVWARACAAQGNPKLANQLFAQAKRIAERPRYSAHLDSTFRQIIAEEIAHTQMWQAVEAFGDPAVSRRDLLTRFARIVSPLAQPPPPEASVVCSPPAMGRDKRRPQKPAARCARYVLIGAAGHYFGRTTGTRSGGRIGRYLIKHLGERP